MKELRNALQHHLREIYLVFLDKPSLPCNLSVPIPRELVSHNYLLIELMIFSKDNLFGSRTTFSPRSLESNLKQSPDHNLLL